MLKKFRGRDIMTAPAGTYWSRQGPNDSWRAVKVQHLLHDRSTMVYQVGVAGPALQLRQNINTSTPTHPDLEFLGPLVEPSVAA